ncbi:DUF6578 domain-containing protein [Streptomyces sp. NPDC001401]|uniref:DUF6578 domain-containing protein n=1 Tax=Streptomyces sp. NPDC001401 TaxID=3364570 RepID=UPI0036B4AF61
MGLWHVYYAGWQMECCGTPFSVGDEVSWQLLFTDADGMLGGGWHEELSKVVGPVGDLPEGDDEDGSVRVLREETGLTVALGGESGADVGPGDRVRLVGLLSVEAHGDEWPEVSGRVRAVRVVSQEYAEMPPGSRSWEPVRGTGARRFRSVDECPKWFADGERGEKGRRFMEAGVVVTLEVAEGDPELQATPAAG